MLSLTAMRGRRRGLTAAAGLALCAIAALSSPVGAQTWIAATPDYGPARWIPANPANYTVADRSHDYPIDMIVIHDIEGSYATGIADFQNPDWKASAHYVVSKTGQITQMVAEKDIAWHAGNWDYNTRSIGIEHEGYAYIPYTYTTAEYQASAHLIASICSRWGVQMDRNHVIGHYQVPDPNHPGQFGGESHHTDPGPYWNWSYYMSLAQGYAQSLPSPPHMVQDATATPGNQSVTLTWRAARTCHTPTASYHVSGEPGDIALDIPGSTTTATIAGLRNGVRYRFTVTAINSDGQDSISSNSVVPFTTPSAPLGVTAVAANASASVSWSIPLDDGGRPISGYVVTAYAGGVTPLPAITFTLTNTMEVVSGLTNGTIYTFVVAAINQGGPGALSAPSNAVSPSDVLRPGTGQGPQASPPPTR